MARAKLTVEDVRASVAAAAEQAGSLGKLAAKWGCSTMYLSDIVNSKRAPGPLVLDRLGLRRVEVVYYEKLRQSR